MLIKLPLGNSFDSRHLPATRVSLVAIARLFELYPDSIRNDASLELIVSGLGVRGGFEARLEDEGLVVHMQKSGGRYDHHLVSDVKSLTSFLGLELEEVQIALADLNLPSDGRLPLDVQIARELIGDFSLALHYLRSCCQREIPRIWTDRLDGGIRTPEASIGISSGFEQSASCWSIFVKCDTKIRYDRSFDTMRDRIELHDALVEWCLEGTKVPGVVVSDAKQRHWRADRILIERALREQ